MSKFGFKEITQDNWLQPDFIMRAFVRADPDEGQIKMKGADWIRAILQPSLDKNIPKDVQALFEVARGAMVYGYFFYPLYTLAAEQLFRVGEAAVEYKCVSMNAPKSKRTLAQRLDWLVESVAISKEDEISWHATRELRNAASHPTRQSIVTPGNAIGALERIAYLINALFGGPEQLDAADPEDRAFC